MTDKVTDNSVRVVSIDDDNLIGNEVMKYVGRVHETDRIAILNVDTFISGHTHYIQNRGSFICLGVNGQGGPCEKYGVPTPYYVFTILHYYTSDRDAMEIDSERIKREGGLGVIKFWKVGQLKMKELRAHNKSTPLKNHDIRLICTEDKFQKMTIIPCADPAYWRRNKNVEKKVLDEVEKIRPKAESLLGRRLTEAQLDAWIAGTPDKGQPASPRAPSIASTEELKDILDSI